VGITVKSAVYANVLIIGMWFLFAYIYGRDRELYSLCVQEDQILEWISFWAFSAASLTYGLSALRQHRNGVKIPWFFSSVALFCLLVALEEISWGQRLFGFRPPDYFLMENLQQELNIHNVFDSRVRRLVEIVIILGFGVVLPAAGSIPFLKRFFQRLGITPFPALLMPAFVATFLLYYVYPWDFAGEIVELMLGKGFLFASFHAYRSVRKIKHKRIECLSYFAVATILLLLLGWVTVGLVYYGTRYQPEKVEAAKGEVKAIAKDFDALARKAARSDPVTRCGAHSRIFYYIRKNKLNDMFNGSFSKLTKSGLPEERARFFIDPWNSPYWINHECSGDKRHQRLFIYSFGPNRRRDSTKWEFSGDDIGFVIGEIGK